MNTEQVQPRIRIIVALNACRRDLGALEIAATLATRRGCELQAVFVEEMNLLNIAELPFIKEIDRLSGTEREFDQTRIARAHRARLSEIQQALDRLIERRQIRASLKIVRGHFVPTVLSFVGEVDVLVLSRRGETQSGGPVAGKSGPGGGRGSTSDRPIWAIVDGSEESLAALWVAADIAATEPCALYVALPANQEALAAELRARLTANPAASPPVVRVNTVEPFDAPALLRSIRQSGCRMLIVKRADGELLENVAEAAECPVILV